MTTNLDLAKVVAARVQIKTVALRKAMVWSSVDPLTPVPELTIRQSHRATHDRVGASGQLDVELDFEFRASEERGDEGSVEVIALDATYVVRYALPEGEEYPDENLRQFAWLNGSYNAWPYWRELVQTVAGRIGVGSITIPVYRPRIEQIPDAEGAGSASET